MIETKAAVKKLEKIADNVYSLTVEVLAPEDSWQLNAGQFLNISTGDGSRLLKRPLGIVKRQGNDVTVCFQVKGEGTLALSRATFGQELYVNLPLGNGFNIPDSAKNVVILGGGVGVFPLVPVLKQYKDKNFYTYLGFRNKACVCLTEEFAASKQLKVVTDDGSYGEKNNAVSAYLKEYKDIPADIIISCGPPVMLRALKASLKEKEITTPCYVSVEERMGCGIGACLVCVCDKTDGTKARVCKDGPVFNIDEVRL